MSGILSMMERTYDSIVIASDCAVYHKQVLVRIEPKVFTSARLPLAVAYRGNAAFGKLVAEKIILTAEESGFNKMMGFVEKALETLPEEPRLEILIAGISETAGATQMMFTNWTPPNNKLYKKFVLNDLGPVFIGFGTDGRAGSFLNAVPPPSPDESIEAWLSERGVSIFEYYRRIPVPVEGDPYDLNSRREYIIGGALTLTVVSAAGATTREIHRWPDIIGEKIDPFRQFSETRRQAA